MQTIVDQNTNTVSYIHVIEALGFENLNINAPPFYIGMLWEKEEGDTQIEVDVRIRSPEGKLITTVPYKKKIDFANITRFRLNLLLSGYKFEEAGVYKFVIRQKPVGGKWKKMDTIPLDVRVVENV